MRIVSAELDRRAFLLLGVAAAAVKPALAAQPFFQRVGLPIGLQLYTVGPEVQKDLDSALKAVAKIGYRKVELAQGYAGHTPAQLRAALDRAGLSCTSAVLTFSGEGSLDGDLSKLATEMRIVGVTTLIAVGAKLPERIGPKKPDEDYPAYSRRIASRMTVDDWKAAAAYLNSKAKALETSGMRVGYHNHHLEFSPVGNTYGLEVLLAETDPQLVTFELDAGWAAAAGMDPFKLLAHHHGRFSQMHIKDIKPGSKPTFSEEMAPADLGTGSLDWKRLLPAAHSAGVRDFYVEQEAPFTHSRIETAKIDYDFLAALQA